MSLEDVNSLDEAEKLKSCPLLLPLDLLPKLKKNQFYYHEVIGYQIIDTIKGQLGIIEFVFTAGNQDLISMKYRGKEVLIPVNNEIVVHADHDKREIRVNLPDGLLDIYLNE